MPVKKEKFGMEFYLYTLESLSAEIILRKSKKYDITTEYGFE